MRDDLLRLPTTQRSDAYWSRYESLDHVQFAYNLGKMRDQVRGAVRCRRPDLAPSKVRLDDPSTLIGSRGAILTRCMHTPQKRHAKAVHQVGTVVSAKLSRAFSSDAFTQCAHVPQTFFKTRPERPFAQGVAECSGASEAG